MARRFGIASRRLLFDFDPARRGRNQTATTVIIGKFSVLRHPFSGAMSRFPAMLRTVCYGVSAALPSGSGIVLRDLDPWGDSMTCRRRGSLGQPIHPRMSVHTDSLLHAPTVRRRDNESLADAWGLE